MEKNYEVMKKKLELWKIIRQKSCINPDAFMIYLLLKMLIVFIKSVKKL